MLSVNQLLEQLVAPAVLGVCSFIVWYLRDLGGAVKLLSERVAVTLEKLSTIAEHLDDHEGRLRNMEITDQPVN